MEPLIDAVDDCVDPDEGEFGMVDGVAERWWCLVDGVGRVGGLVECGSELDRCCSSREEIPLQRREFGPGDVETGDRMGGVGCTAGGGQ